MKWNMILGALIVSVSMSGQSFGFELLDQLLGMGGGCGCNSCCEKPCGAPADCGCAPKCCKKSRCCKPKCCNPKCCKSRCNSCCAPKPDCGCASKCCKKRCCLMDLFRCKKSCCNSCESSCGCGAGGEGAVIEGDAAPMPPAPMADPSAWIPSKRRVAAVR